MKTVMLMWIIAAVWLVSACASNPPPAEPRRADQSPPPAAARREAPPRAKSAELGLEDVLGAVLPEPVQAGKNIVIPIDAGGSGKSGPLSCVGVCRRIIGDCLLETLAATGKIPPQQIEKMKRSGMLDKFRRSASRHCGQTCAKPGTKNHARILAAKACAREKTCAAVGACAAKHIK